MKFTLLNVLVFTCLITSNVVAQDDLLCGTEASARDIKSLEIFNKNRLSQSKFSSARVDQYFVGITAHIVRKDDGTGGLSKTQLTDALVKVNERFEDTNITFFLLGEVNYIHSDTYYDFDSNQEFGLTSRYNVPNSINIYFFNSATSGGSALCGYAYFPASQRDHIVMANSCVTNGSTLSHEIGHYFALYHTHGKTNTGTTDELVDGSNCETAGDDVCDTVADPNLSGRVSEDCVYTGVASDANGQLFSPDPRNLMSYSRQQCRDYFTVGQEERIVDAYLTYKTYLANKYYIANFDSEKNRICEGSAVKFIDRSVAASTYQWEFAGGNPSTSTEKDPEIQYDTNGDYDVSLTITTEVGDQETIFLEDYVKVRKQTSELSEVNGSFETPELTEELINQDNGISFEVVEVASSEGNRSAMIDFFNYEAVDVEDFLVLGNINTTTNKQIQISFDYAYAKYDDLYFDALALSYKDPCGDWVDLWRKEGDGLATAVDHQVKFIPEANEWKTVTIGLQVPEELDATEFAFRAINGNGNNLYIDNYNVQPATFSVNIDELSVTNATCSNSQDGAISISTNPSTNVVYSVDGNNYVSESTIGSLLPGNYNLYVKNNANNEVIVSSFFLGPNPISYSVEIVASSCSNEKDGSVMVSVSGGTGLLEIDFGGTGFSNVNTFENLTSKSYSFTVRDENGCTVVSNAYVPSQNNSPTIPVVNMLGNSLIANTDSQVKSIQWYRDGEKVEGATTVAFPRPSKGSYTVEVSNGFCTSVSKAFLILSAQEIEASLEIFPNPTDDFLNIKLSENLYNEIESASITDLTGKVIKKVDFTSIIKVSGLESGIYILNFELDGIIVSRRFLKR